MLLAFHPSTLSNAQPWRDHRLYGLMSEFDSSAPIDVRLLHTFDAVVRLGSATAAAQALGRTQSAISHRIRELEQDLGHRLFERTGRTLVLTPHGERLHDLCVDVVALSQDLRRRFLDDDEPDGKVRLGALSAIAAHLVAPRLADVVANHPRIRVDVSAVEVEGLVDQVRGAGLDFAVIVGHAMAPDLIFERLGSVSMVVVFPPDTPIEQGATVTVDELRATGLRYLAYGRAASPTFIALDRFALESGLIDDRTPRIPFISTLRGTVAGGGGYTLLPSYVTVDDVEQERMRSASVEGLDQSQPVHLIRRRSMVPTPALQVVLEALREIEP